MKKILLIVLLTILPIQYAWSMAAVYCQHEQGKVTHFGHHGHQHQVQADDQSDHGTPSKAKANAHGDCEVCHHAVQASVLDHVAVAAPAAASGYAAPSYFLYLSHIAEGPPRPNWLLVA